MESMRRYQLFSINYCQFITLKFIVGLLWVTGLRTVAVMLDDVLPSLPRPLVLPAQPAIVQQRKDTNVKRIYPNPRAKPATHLDDIARKSCICSICPIQFENK
jgi:hypothetical protein